MTLRGRQLFLALLRCRIVRRLADLDDIVNILDNCFWYDAVCLIVSVLNLTAAVGLADRALHRARDRVGIHNDLAFGVSRGSADGLDQRGFGAQKALLVGVKNGDKRYLGQVQPLAEQIDADQHVKFAKAQIANDLHTLDRFHVVVDIAHTDTVFL